MRVAELGAATPVHAGGTSLAFCSGHRVISRDSPRPYILDGHSVIIVGKCQMSAVLRPAINRQFMNWTPASLFRPARAATILLALHHPAVVESSAAALLARDPANRRLPFSVTEPEAARHLASTGTITEPALGAGGRCIASPPGRPWRPGAALARDVGKPAPSGQGPAITANGGTSAAALEEAVDRNDS